MVSETILSVLKTVSDYKTLEDELWRIVSEQMRVAVVAVLEQVDEELSKSREKGLRFIGYRERSVLGIFGEIRLRRRYYRRRDGSYVFLIDEALGLPPEGSLVGRLQEAAIQMSTCMPFRKAAEFIERLTGQKISHQTIHRHVQEVGKAAVEADKERRRALFDDGEIVDGASTRQETKHLFLEADGVMVALQRETARKAELKLGVAHAGWERVHPASDRYRLTGKVAFCTNGDSQEFWEGFTAELRRHYELGGIEQVFVNGDGAPWIKEGPSYFTGAVFQLDRFHLMRGLRRGVGRDADRLKVLHEALRNRDVEQMLVAVSEAAERAERPERRKELLALHRYLSQNRDGLVDYRQRGVDLPADLRGLGAAESNIDKILADRMKKRGMAWSRTGAHRMAKLLAMRSVGRLEEHLLKYQECYVRPILHTVAQRVEIGQVAKSAYAKQGVLPALNTRRFSPLGRVLHDIAVDRGVLAG